MKASSHISAAQSMSPWQNLTLPNIIQRSILRGRNTAKERKHEEHDEGFCRQSQPPRSTSSVTQQPATAAYLHFDDRPHLSLTLFVDYCRAWALESFLASAIRLFNIRTTTIFRSSNKYFCHFSHMPVDVLHRRLLVLAICYNHHTPTPLRLHQRHIMVDEVLACIDPIGFYHCPLPDCHGRWYQHHKLEITLDAVALVCV